MTSERGWRIDTLWGAPVVAYNVQIRFDDEMLDLLTGLTRAIEAAWPGALYVIPRESLHISVYPLVAARSAYDKEAYWAAIRERSLALLKESARRHAPFPVTLSQVTVTDTAVILTGEDDGTLASVRQTLRADLPAPPEPPPATNLIHTTLARYRCPTLLPDEFSTRAATLGRPLTTLVRSLTVRCERIYPSLADETVATFPLGPDDLAGRIGDHHVDGKT